ncbi:hypothetical protein [Flagellimonas sp.]|uniref:hypothetical protein n=1 Tax=Flagellimonas sp. TaxID=2058762 RepID=UPI003B5BF9C5
MKALWCFLVFFGFVQLHGQKLVKKALINPETEYIQINSQYCYDVKLHTSNTTEVEVVASIEGEYSKDLLVSIEESSATMLISTGFQPNFSNPNDKLSAHKVVSIALDIILPEHKNVLVYGTNSNVLVEGKYRNLEVKLSDGRCTIDNVTETVAVTTQKGDILLLTSNGNIVAKSTYGKVLQENIPSGHNQYKLNTIEGTIHLRKTK